MAPLHKKYRVQIGQWIAELEPVLVRLKQGASTPQVLAAVRARAHSSAGSGSTYGFTQITKTAEALEELLKTSDSPDLGLVAALLESFLTACRDALTQSD